MPKLPKVIDTGRLILKLAEGEDLAAFTDAILSSHAELKPWMDWAQEPQTLEATENYHRESEQKWRADEALNLLIVERSSGEMVGSCGYPRLDWSLPSFEIGYWCRTDRVGRGYISEATWELARFAFEELGAVRVELKMDDLNARSWRVAERLGFSHEGTLNNDARAPDGSLRNSRIYAAIRLDALKQPG